MFNFIKNRCRRRKSPEVIIFTAWEQARNWARANDCQVSMRGDKEARTSDGHLFTDIRRTIKADNTVDEHHWNPRAQGWEWIWVPTMPTTGDMLRRWDKDRQRERDENA